jgi:hypothetical protein
MKQFELNLDTPEGPSPSAWQTFLDALVEPSRTKRLLQSYQLQAACSDCICIPVQFVGDICEMCVEQKFETIHSGDAGFEV